MEFPGVKPLFPVFRMSRPSRKNGRNFPLKARSANCSLVRLPMAGRALSTS